MGAAASSELMVGKYVISKCYGDPQLGNILREWRYFAAVNSGTQAAAVGASALGRGVALGWRGKQVNFIKF